MFTWDGWDYGDDACDPPEPDKRWLTIRDRDGEEYCVIVQRKVNGEFDEQAGLQRETRAARIVSSLNAVEARA